MPLKSHLTFFLVSIAVTSRCFHPSSSAVKKTNEIFRILPLKENFPFDNRKSGEPLCFLFRSIAFGFLLFNCSVKRNQILSHSICSFVTSLFFGFTLKKGEKNNERKKHVNKKEQNTERVYRHTLQ
jgi:hypothetical protein